MLLYHVVFLSRQEQKKPLKAVHCGLKMEGTQQLLKGCVTSGCFTKLCSAFVCHLAELSFISACGQWGRRVWRREQQWVSMKPTLWASVLRASALNALREGEGLADMCLTRLRDFGRDGWQVWAAGDLDIAGYIKNRRKEKNSFSCFSCTMKT